VSITFFQDWDTTGSLSNLLFNNEGETVPLRFAPVNKTGKTIWEADVKLTPGQVGGAGDAFMVATVSLGIQGRPDNTTKVA
jgi:hypothetical protein